MRPKEISIAPVAADPDGICVAQAVALAKALTLNGALISGGKFTGDYARRIGILSAGDDSGDTFTVVGTDADGKALTESISGANAGTAETVGYFKTVTSVSTDGAAAGNVSVGTVDEFVTNTIPIEISNSEPASVSVENLSGAMNMSIDETFSRIQYTDDIKWNESPMGPTGSDAESDMSLHASGLRFRCNSYTTGATISMIVNQNRNF
jgi:hypothetical protein